MTKFQKLFKDIEDLLNQTGLYPKAYNLRDGVKMKKSKGYDRTQDQFFYDPESPHTAVRNQYGEGWNAATMKMTNLLAEILDKYDKEKK